MNLYAIRSGNQFVEFYAHGWAQAQKIGRRICRERCWMDGELWMLTGNPKVMHND